MREIPLSVERRTTKGKGAARQNRRDGQIPGVLYGPDIDPVSVAVDERAFRAAMKEARGHSIMNIQLDGKETKAVLREMQRDPVTNRVLHIDFHAIAMNKPIHIRIPIHCVGTAHGVKVDGGIMQQTMRELPISCLPTNIPDDVEVDVSDLGIGDAIHISDLDLPNVEILAEERRTIVVISAPTVIKAAATEEEEGELEEGAEAAEGEEAEEGAEGEEKAEGKAEGEDEKKEKKEKKAE
jgi:large subunit ribosomal protein L25